MKQKNKPGQKQGARKKTGKRSKAFNVVLAVKHNARAQVGQPSPARVFSEKTPERQRTKHKATFAEQLAGREEGE